MTRQETIKFLRAMRKIDKLDVTPRDVLMLWSIMTKPGQAGNDIMRSLGLRSRSSIQNRFPVYERMGYIEDRRPGKHLREPNAFHITDKGVKFLVDLFGD